jgi:hypothetical protein
MTQTKVAPHLAGRCAELDLDYIEHWVTEMGLPGSGDGPVFMAVARWRPGFEGSFPW